jgi:TPR repeat protein
MNSREVLAVGFAVLSLGAVTPAGAQDSDRAQMSKQSAAQRYAAGLAMEKRKDERGAFTAYLEAAEEGHPPAQRRLGEIYDSGNSAVERNYSESIRWYEKAREGGEIIPAPIPRTPIF